MEKINKDMVDNIDKTVYQATGYLDKLIQKWNELYEAQTKITNKTTEEIARENGLYNSDINDLVIDPNSGLKYNKNTDYQALINNLEKEKQRQIKESGTYETWIDDQIKNYNNLRNAKITNEGSKEAYQAVGSAGKYTIGSAAGKNFLTNAKAGETMTGGDGSTWTKNKDGSVTIKKGSNTYEIGALTKNSSSGGSSSSSGGSSKGSNSSGGSSSSGSYTGTSSSGGTYTIGSDRGKNFVDTAKAGDTITGGDGSKWTKNSDGSTTISKGNKTYTVGKKSYATGGVNDEYGFAALHGERQRAEVIFNAEDAKKLWNWIHDMDENCNIEDIGAATKSLMSSLVKSNTDNSTDIHIEHLELPSVKDSNSFVKQLKLISLNR